MAWYGDSDGHRRAALKGHRATMRRASKVNEGERVSRASEERYYKRRDQVVGKGVYGPMSIHESRSYGAKKAAKTRARNKKRG